MEDSILKSVKLQVNLLGEYTAFDQMIITYINSTFMVLQQLGVGPKSGHMIEDDTSTWTEYFALLGDDINYNAVKTYMGLKVRLLFDPPQTSFVIEAINKQISELEWRLNVHREEDAWVPPVESSSPTSIETQT